MKGYLRPLRLVWLLGLAVLIASSAGAIWALKTPAAASPPQDSKTASAPARGNRRVVCYGYVGVESGTANLFPLQPGRVVEVLAKESQNVHGPVHVLGMDIRPGQVLLKLDDRHARDQVNQAEADRKAAQSDLDQARKLPEKHRLDVIKQEAAIEAMQADLAAANFVWERKKNLLKGKVGSAEEVSAAGQMVKKLEAGEKAELARLEELKLVDPQLQIRRAEAQLSAKQAQLDMARYALDQCSLRAPQDGQVLQILVSAGDVLGCQSTRPAITFCPSKPWIVRAEVEQEFAGRLETGQIVAVHDEGGSGNWSGKIIRISASFNHSRAQQDQIRLNSNDVRILECIIELQGDRNGLRIGQRVLVETK